MDAGFLEDLAEGGLVRQLVRFEVSAGRQQKPSLRWWISNVHVRDGFTTYPVAVKCRAGPRVMVSAKLAPSEVTAPAPMSVVWSLATARPTGRPVPARTGGAGSDRGTGGTSRTTGSGRGCGGGAASRSVSELVEAAEGEHRLPLDQRLGRPGVPVAADAEPGR